MSVGVKKERRILLIFFIFASLAVVSSSASGARSEQRTLLRVCIHIDSAVSGGKYTIEDVARIAEEYKIDALLFTDRLNMEIDYGLWPFRGIVRKRKRIPSVATLGPRRYLREIREAQAKHKDLIIVPGVEALPCYYWKLKRKIFIPTPSRLAQVLTLCRAHEHVLALGLDKPEDYKRLPTMSNGLPIAWFRVVSRLFWITVCILAAWGCFRFASKRDRRASRSGREKNGARVLGIGLAGFAVLSLVDMCLCPPRIYTPYDGDPGTGPAQLFFDEAAKLGALTFWAHPEVATNMTINGIHEETPAYPDHLMTTNNYTGFAIFWEGMKVIGKPGGEWDRILTAYCRGIRKNPVWAIGEIDFDENRHPRTICEVMTFVWVYEKTQDEVLDALRHGAMYATRNFYSEKLRIKEYALVAGVKKALSGETLHCESAPILQFEVEGEALPGDLFLVVVQDGRVEEKRKLTANEMVRVPCSPVPPGERSFVRLLIYQRDFAVVATNPIFFQSAE